MWYATGTDDNQCAWGCPIDHGMVKSNLQCRGSGDEQCWIGILSGENDDDVCYKG